MSHPLPHCSSLRRAQPARMAIANTFSQPAAARRGGNPA
eukprot:CAMPEP_0202763142 /NCGR_PEP_ID=MMETSP1388-20130828/22621_1 /ASSEMBLY_ACC=CAM_ASM_000864 /TAXON_ID=37098 /ORGANISM="Isochrysis sp, Strain CCMP1244" /LENGTH=38 /DNA_ID= /DNA_START= /DNA_END= /DNA_ORIENTATION=